MIPVNTSKCTSTIVFFLFIFFQQAFLFAQDTLVYNSGKKSIVQIITVTDEKIVFKKWPIDSLEPLYSIPANAIKIIHFYSGFTISYSYARYSTKTFYKNKRIDSTVIRKKLLVKTDIFSWFTYRGAFSIEKILDDVISIEGSVGFAGWGLGSELFRQQYVKGAYYRGGLKINTSRNKYPQQGIYLKPEFVYVQYSYPLKCSSVSTFTFQGMPGIAFLDLDCKGEITGRALIINVGWQKLLSNRFVIDAYAGAGYGIKKRRLIDLYKPYNAHEEISFSINENSERSFDNHFGFAVNSLGRKTIVFQAGVKIGFMF